MTKYNINIDEFLNYVQIDNLKESEIINEAIVNFDKLQASSEKNLKTIKKFLIDHGVSLSYIKSNAKISSKIIKKGFDKGTNPEVLSKQIQNKVVTPMLKKVVKGSKIKEKIAEAEAETEVNTGDELSVGEKILKSILIFVIIFFMNSIILNVVALIFGTAGVTLTIGGIPLAVVLFSIIAAPIIEETAKKYAIDSKYPFIYTGIFAGLELVQYVLIAVFNPAISIGKFIIIRVMTLLMHFSTTLVMKYFKERGEETDNEKMAKIGFIIAISIHVTWNTIAILLNPKLGAWLAVKN